MNWQYNNGYLSIQLSYGQSTSTGIKGSGDYLFILPPGFEFDSSIPKYTDNILGAIPANLSYYAIPGEGTVGNNNSHRRARAIPYSSRAFRLQALDLYQGAQGTFLQCVNSTQYHFELTYTQYRIAFTVKVDKI